MDASAARIVEFLEQNEESYQEYSHFVILPEEDGKRTSVVTLIYVHTSLLKENLFTRNKMHKIVFDEPSFGGAYVVNFDIFDTTVRFVNCQLSSGPQAQKLRLNDIQQLMATLNDETPADHTFLVGDFAATNVSEAENCHLRNYMNCYNSVPEWTNDRFKFLLEEFDEVKTSLREKCPEFQEFKELEVAFPPTNHRVRNRVPKITESTLAEIFHPSFDLESLFLYDNDIPCYPDRIFFQTKDPNLASCLKSHTTGTCEGVMFGDHVPVFSTFRVGSRVLGLVKDPRSSSELKEIRNNYQATTKGLNSEKLKLIEKKASRETEEIKAKALAKQKDPELLRTFDFSVTQSEPEQLATNDEEQHREEVEKTPPPPDSPPPEEEQEKIVVFDEAKFEPKVKTEEKNKEDKEQMNEEALETSMKALTQALGAIANFAKSSGKLDGLQDSIDDFGQHAHWGDKQIGVCEGCLQEVYSSESHFDTGGKHFHEECFNCVSCRKSIKSNYYFINSHLYCKECYKDLFNPICMKAGCKERITGPKIQTDKGNYHVDCFKCSLCNAELTDSIGDKVFTKDFVYRGNSLLCLTHAAYTSGRICFVCNESITDGKSFETVLNSGELLDVHTDCFSCSECGKFIAGVEEHTKGKKFCYTIKDKEILCEVHGKMSCGTCGDKIYNMQGYREIFDVKYHLKCVPNCSVCNKKLASKDSIIQNEDDGALVCGVCAKQQKIDEMKKQPKERDLRDTPPMKLAQRAASSRSTLDGRKLDVLPQSSEEIKFYESNPPPPPPSTFSIEDEGEGLVQNSRVMRKNTRYSAFTGFSLPPPPPYSLLEENVDIDEVAQQEPKTMEQHAKQVFSRPKQNSLVTVGTNLTNAIGLGEQLRDLLNAMSNLNTNNMMQKDNYGSMKNLRSARDVKETWPPVDSQSKSTLPPPPPPPPSTAPGDEPQPQADAATKLSSYVDNESNGDL